MAFEHVARCPEHVCPTGDGNPEPKEVLRVELDLQKVKLQPCIFIICTPQELVLVSVVAIWLMLPDVIVNSIGLPYQHNVTMDYSPLWRQLIHPE